MRLVYLDLLKSYAIVVVVLFHFGLLKYGYLGVDVFFVFAGYLTSKSLDKYGDLINFKNYISFEYNRIKRLLPLLLFACLVCLVYGYFFMLPDDYENLAQSIVASSTFSNNVLQYLTTSDYWASSNDYKPLMHTWYLGVLMQFYLLYPLLFFIKNIFRKSVRDIAFYCLLLMIGCVSFGLYVLSDDQSKFFYFFEYRAYEFLLGALTFYLNKHKSKIIYRCGLKTFIFSSVLLVILTTINSNTIISDKSRLILVVFMSTLSLASIKSLKRLDEKNILVKLSIIGVSSYSLYIWHQVVIALYRYSFTHDLSIDDYSILALLIVSLTYISYKVFERGIEHVIKTHRRVFNYSLLAIFLFTNICSTYVYLKAGIMYDVPELDVKKENAHRGFHSEYNDRIYKMDKEFVHNDKIRCLIVGNSFGRDWANVLLESKNANIIEISYCTIDQIKDRLSRVKSADIIFLTRDDINIAYVERFKTLCRSCKELDSKLFVVGDKRFGCSNGVFYKNRWSETYFQQTVCVPNYIIKNNAELRQKMGNKFIDILSCVYAGDNRVRVFTNNRKYISQDCKHLTKAGAKFIADRIDWSLMSL